MVDITKTRQQLVYRAAKKLGVTESGEAPSAEDYDTFDGLVDPLIAQLAADGVYYIGDDDAIDVAIFEPLASLLANEAGPDFGSPINDDARIRDERTMRRIGSTKPTYEVLKAVYY